MKRAFVTFLLGAVIAFGVAMGVASAAVAPPQSHPYGLSYSQLAGRWTQWALAMPSSYSPFAGSGPCGEDQVGRVFFLPIQFGPGAAFTCRVGVGESLLASPIGAVCSPASGDGTGSQLLACAKSAFTLVDKVAISIDGRAVPDALRWRFVSPVVPVTLPRDNILNATPGPSTAITGGWFYLIRPLPVGWHHIATLAHLILPPPFGAVTVRFNYAIQVVHP